MWLNGDEQRTDWIKKLDQSKFEDSISYDKSTETQESTSTGCPVMILRQIENSNSMSALITSKDCNSKARVLCILDLLKPTINVGKKPNLSCLQTTNSTSTNGEKADGRKKRDTNSKMSEQTGLKKIGKISVYIIYIVNISFEVRNLKVTEVQYFQKFLAPQLQNQLLRKQQPFVFQVQQEPLLKILLLRKHQQLLQIYQLFGFQVQQQEQLLKPLFLRIHQTHLHRKVRLTSIGLLFSSFTNLKLYQYVFHNHLLHYSIIYRRRKS